MKVSKEFLQSFINGKTLSDASKELNVHRDTMTKWIKRFNLKPTYSKGKSPRKNGKDVALFAVCFGNEKAMKEFNKTKEQVYKCVWKLKKGSYK